MLSFYRYKLNAKTDPEVLSMLVDLTNYARDKISQDRKEALIAATKSKQRK